ncbi:hypothetical protein BH09BAC6_BH09BAC6_16760 [soil metagenome]
MMNDFFNHHSFTFKLIYHEKFNYRMRNGYRIIYHYSL